MVSPSFAGKLDLDNFRENWKEGETGRKQVSYVCTTQPSFPVLARQ